MSVLREHYREPPRETLGAFRVSTDRLSPTQGHVRDNDYNFKNMPPWSSLKFGKAKVRKGRLERTLPQERKAAYPPSRS